MGLHTTSERELCDGRVVIYQRTDTMTAVWQCRIAFPGQPYIRQSLKTRNEAEAVKLATKLYEDLRYRHESGLPIRRKRFEEVLDLYLGNLSQEVEFGTQKAKKLDDQRKMSRYCREYFEGRLIDTIKTSDVEKFQDWRRKYWVSGPGSKVDEYEYQREGKTVRSKRVQAVIPAASTLNSEAVLLRSIFAYAVKHDWIADNQVPDIGEKIPSAKKARDAKRRPGLDPDQVRHLLQVAYRRMYEEKDNPRLWHQRLMLWAYTGFLAHTGMRPFEAILVRWKDISLTTIHGDEPCWRIRTMGKGGDRERFLIPLDGVGVYINELIEYKLELKNKDLPPEQRIGNIDWDDPSPVFYEYRGEEIGSFSRGFAALMKEADLYVDDKGKTRDAYCLRHYYATERLLSGVSIYTLAENMGTSVGVIQQHYGHLRPEMAANELTQISTAERERLRQASEADDDDE